MEKYTTILYVGIYELLYLLVTSLHTSLVNIAYVHCDTTQKVDIPTYVYIGCTLPI